MTAQNIRPLSLNPDAILRLKGEKWIISNPKLRTHVELASEASKLLFESSQKTKTAEEWMTGLSEVKGKDRSRRGIGAKGLVSDHSCFLEQESDKWLSGKELFDLLVRSRVLISDYEQSLSAIKPLSGLLDKESLGSFHQRVGQYILLERRAKEPWREWQNQKFSLDGKNLLENSYKFVQEPFFDKYFTSEYLKNKKVLDFGCGNAYYSAKLAQNGAQVLALDNSQELLTIAQENHGHLKNLELKRTDSFEEVISLLDSFGPESFDLIYLQDTLLLLLKPETEAPSNMLPAVFKCFNRILKKDGKLCAMEPNPIFWLCGRYGESQKPYAVITEYKNPVFNVAPNLDVLTSFMSENKFALLRLIHPETTSPSKNADFGYQSEFPMWDFYEFIPLK